MTLMEGRNVVQNMLLLSYIFFVLKDLILNIMCVGVFNVFDLITKNEKGFICGL